VVLGIEGEQASTRQGQHPRLTLSTPTGGFPSPADLRRAHRDAGTNTVPCPRLVSAPTTRMAGTPTHHPTCLSWLGLGETWAGIPNRLRRSYVPRWRLPCQTASRRDSDQSNETLPPSSNGCPTTDAGLIGCPILRSVSRRSLSGSRPSMWTLTGSSRSSITCCSGSRCVGRNAGPRWMPAGRNAGGA
jgi:hypothetical protein